MKDFTMPTCQLHSSPSTSSRASTFFQYLLWCNKVAAAGVVIMQEKLCVGNCRGQECSDLLAVLSVPCSVLSLVPQVEMTETKRKFLTERRERERVRVLSYSERKRECCTPGKLLEGA